MTLVMFLALALGAFQVEEIIVERFPDHDVAQVIPASHPAAEYEWRIQGWFPGVPTAETAVLELTETGDRILETLGAGTDADWELSGFMNPEMRYDEYLSPDIFLMGKKDNLAFLWGHEGDEFVVRLVVFDPDRVPLYLEQGSK